jgi:hypothetical protein
MRLGYLAFSELTKDWNSGSSRRLLRLGSLIKKGQQAKGRRTIHRDRGPTHAAANGCSAATSTRSIGTATELTPAERHTSWLPVGSLCVF